MTSDNPRSDNASSEKPSDKGPADKPPSNNPQPDNPLSDKAATSSSEGSTAKPRIGDSRPAPESKAEKSPSPRAGGDDPLSGSGSETRDDGQPQKRKRRRRSNSASEAGSSQGDTPQNDRQDGQKQDGQKQDSQKQDGQRSRSQKQGNQKQGSQKQGNQKQGGFKQQNSNQKRGKGRQRQRGGGAPVSQPVQHVVADAPVELDEKQLKRRRGRSRKGRPVGRYMMVVSKREESTHIAVVEGRQLVEYVVSRPSDDVTQIHGNIYLGKVQNVLPGMEAAFVDVGTPKNAVLYRSDVTAPATKGDGKGGKKEGGKGRGRARGNSGGPKIEELLKPRQMVLCQVVKNPIAHKGARLTMEVSLPGRFVVLVPNSDTYGISKRLPDSERKRLRQLLDRIRPKGHGLIVRTAAENVTAEEIERDVLGLQQQWEEIDALAKRTQQASLLYREPDMSTRVIREEFNMDYRAVIIDNEPLYDEISDYVSVITPALAERVEFYDAEVEPISVFERYHIHEQLHKALDRKVWLPSGGSLIIEGTEALTVIDVNTGKNVGSSSLEETVFRNNLEAAEEVAHQLRLRDIGGIIVIDFVDMEDRKNREEVIRVFRKALSRDKTRTQAFGISDLGLVEMTRKRIGEGLVESMSGLCPDCEGRGLRINEEMIDKLLR